MEIFGFLQMFKLLFIFISFWFAIWSFSTRLMPSSGCPICCVTRQFEEILTFFCLIFKVLLFTYTSSCELLTPIWLVVVLIAPLYFYLVANSAIHFAIMLERIRATLFVRNYEREGFRCGIFGVLVVVELLKH